MSSERLPAAIAPRTVDVIRPDRSMEALAREIESVRSIAATPPSRILRRFVFVWFRIFVRETKHDKVERVNIKIPIPIPVLGGLFPPRISRAKALHALALARDADDPASAMSDYLDSVMGFEFIRVEDRKSADVHSLVVLGFD